MKDLQLLIRTMDVAREEAPGVPMGLYFYPA